MSAERFSFPPSTPVNNLVTPEQREQYERDGFFVVRGCVSPHVIDQITTRFIAICNKQIQVPGLTILKDISFIKQGVQKAEELLVNKLQGFENDDVLFEYCKLPEVLRIIQDIIGRNVMAMHTMLINKPPDAGTQTSRHPLHQDLHYFPFRPANRIVCAWTAMEDITEENGCLVVIPGTHHGALQVHEYPKWEGGVNTMYHGIQNYNPAAERVHLHMRKGDTVFFHPLLIHGSGANKSQRCRKAISCHYAASECRYIDVAGTTQQNIADEVETLAQRKVGPDVKVAFADVFRIRGRLVAGVAANL